MARSFGNTGSNSLLRASESALNKTNAYNDALASFEFDTSAKTAEDYATYKSYLDKRVKTTQNSDPSKALSLTRTAVSANRTFNSAEISRATTAVKYGTMSNRDKYEQIGHLLQAAISNGDDNLAQSLDGQMASLSITIQNEEAAAARAGEAANDKQLAANKRGVDTTVSAFDKSLKVLKDQVLSGKMSTQDYEEGVAKTLEGKRQFLEAAANGQVAGLSEDAAASYAKSHDDLVSSDTYRNSLTKFPEAHAGNPSQYLSVDPARRGADGGILGELKDRTQGQATLMKDANGNEFYQHTYTGGFSDYSKGPNGENVYTGKPGDRQSLLDKGNTDYVFGQAGADKKIGFVGGKPIKDAKGNWFVVDQNGKKHYVNSDPNAVLQRSSTPINDLPDFGPTTTTGQLGINAKPILAGLKGVAKTMIPGVGLLSQIFGRNDKAKQQQAELAAAKARNDALVVERNRQQALLPVFRAPAYLPPPPAPKTTPKVAAYTPAPLPGQAGYVNPIAKTQATIADPKSSARDALKSLIGF